MTAPIGLFGGTFDPIHLGHLRLAEELGEALGCNEVRFLPSGTPPHRQLPLATATARRDMVALAIADNPRFSLDEREITRTGPCYMVDTLTAIRAEAGAHTPLCLFLGGDAFMGLTTWHRWTELFNLAHLAIAHRPGFSPQTWDDRLPDALRHAIDQRLVKHPADLAMTPAGHIYLHAITQMDIAARRIRSACRKRESVRYLVPDSVRAYLNQHDLYRQ